MYLRSGEQLVSRYLTSLQGSALMQPLLHIELQIVPLLHQSTTVAGILKLPMHLPHADSYVVTVLGNLATLEYSEGDIVIATMRFQNREYNGQMYMDVVAVELIKK